MSFRIQNLLNDAKATGGDEITAEMYPRNERNRNRIFTLTQLKRAREMLEGKIYLFIFLLTSICCYVCTCCVFYVFAPVFTYVNSFMSMHL